MRQVLRWVVLMAVAACAGLAAASGTALAKGPIILAGIDAEDGGVDGHGPIENYATMAQSVLASVTTSGAGILVFGGGRGTDVEAFWTMIGARTGRPVTFAHGEAARTASLAGVAMVGVASSVHGTGSGGLTDADNASLVARRGELVDFVNGGGGLLGFSQTGFAQPYAYVGFGGVETQVGLRYSDITPDLYAGAFAGVTDALDVCCWHDTYTSYPGFMKVLGVDTGTSNAAVIGGLSVQIDERCSASRPARPVTCPLSNEEQQTVLKESALAETAVESSLALAACEAGSGRGLRGKRRGALRAGAKALCDVLLKGALALAGGASPQPDTARVAELPEVRTPRPPRVSTKGAGCRRRDRACKDVVRRFRTYVEATNATAALLHARAVATNRLEAARATGRPGLASLQLGAVKAFSAALAAKEAVRERAGRKLSHRLRKAGISSKVRRSQVRGARARLAGPRARGGEVARGLARSGLLPGTAQAPLLARRALGSVPSTQDLDLRRLLARRSTSKGVHDRLAQHVQLAELRRMLDALTAGNVLPGPVREALAADLDRAACAATPKAREDAVKGFVEKAGKGVRGRSRTTLLGAARQLTRYREGVHDPITACRAAPPLLPPPPPAPTLEVTPPTADRTTAEPHVLTLTARETATGTPPSPGRTVRWTVTGANASSGSVTTDAGGVASVTLTSAVAGQDAFTAFVDLDGDGTKGPGEPQDTATVDWRLVQTGDMEEHSAGLSPAMGPTSIITAPDGTMWFTGRSGRLGRVATDGTITDFGWSRTTTTRPLLGIALGPDGKLYVTESNTDTSSVPVRTRSGAILRIDPANPTAEPVVVLDLRDSSKLPAPCNVDTIDREPVGILAAFGSIWFTTDTCATVGRIDPSAPGRAVYATGIPSPVNRGYRGIAVGPDNASLYFGVARSSTPGTYARSTDPAATPPSVTELSLPGSPTTSDKTFSVVTGRDGNVWFTGVNALYRVVPADATQNRRYTGVSTSFSDGPQNIVNGPDDNIWIADRNGGDITRISDLADDPPTVTAFPIPGSTTQGLTAGADGGIWFTEQGSNAIGRAFVGP